MLQRLIQDHQDTKKIHQFFKKKETHLNLFFPNRGTMVKICVETYVKT